MVSLVGQTVSHYSILDHIGGGGMGIVYKAQDVRLGRTVALKFLPPELTRDLEAKDRFFHEARAASALQHNNIGVVHDIVETETGQLFIVMEYYEGETLKRKVSRGMLSIAETVDIVSQVAAGLARAHKHGIVHRDIKPANIMITPEGVVKIVDFGLAKLSGQTSLTRTGTTLGTTAYMSPEQAQSSDVDGRTDIWSLGIVLYELLAGRRPFDSDFEQALVYSIIYEDPPDITGFRQGIPPHLIALCRSCLAKDRESRPQSMEQFSRWLGKGPTARDSAARLWDANRKWRKTEFLFGIGIVLLIIIASFMKLRSPASVVPQGKIVIGLVRFENPSRDTNTASWPTFIQERLFDNFAGRMDIAVFDPVTSNKMIEGARLTEKKTHADAVEGEFSETPVRFVVDGSIDAINSGNTVEMRVRDLRNEFGTRSTTLRVAGGEGLANGVDTLSEWLYESLLSQYAAPSPQSDTGRWRQPKVHFIPAVSAFAMGSESNYRGDSLAIEYFKRATQIDWAYIPPKAWFISRLIAQGSLEEATQNFRALEALRIIGSPYEDVLIDWAGALVNNDFQGQMRALTQLLEYSPGNNLLIYYLARLKYIQWDFSGCVEVLKPLLKTNWEFSRMYFLLAQAQEQLGKLAEARRSLEQSVACEPVHPESFALLSTMCRRDQDSSLASKYETLYVQSMGNRGFPAVDAYATIARLSIDRGQDRNANRYFGLAEEARPNYPPFHLGRGEALLFLGDTTAAAKEFRRALALNPQYADPLYRLGEIFEGKGDRKQSQMYTQSYLRLDSAGTHAREARARLARIKQ